MQISPEEQYNELQRLFTVGKYSEITSLYERVLSPSMSSTEFAEALANGNVWYIHLLLVTAESYYKLQQLEASLAVTLHIETMVSEFIQKHTLPGSDKYEILQKLFTIQGNSRRYLGEITAAKEDFSQALHYAELLQHPLLIAKSCVNLGVVFRILGNFLAAFEYYERALEGFRSLNATPLVGLVLGNIGNLYLNLANYPKALEYYSEALIINEQLGRTDGIASTLSNIGVIHAELNDHSRAIESYKRALALEESNNNRVGQTSRLMNIGNSFSALGEYQTALEYLHKSLSISEELGLLDQQSSCYMNIGIVHTKTGNLPEAVASLQRALQLDNEHGFINQLSYCYMNIAILLLEFPSAQDFFDGTPDSFFLKSLEIAERLGKKNHQKKLCLDLSKYYSSTDNWKEAFSYLERHHQLTLTIENEKVQHSVQLQTIRSLEREREIIQAKNKELDTAYSQLQSLSTFKDSMLGFIVHDLKNPLTTIINCSQEPDMAAEFHESISDAGYQMLRLINNILDIQMFSEDKMIPDFKTIHSSDLLTTVLKQVTHPANERGISIVHQCENINFRCDPTLISRVIVNLLINAIKYSPENGIINVSCSLSETHITFSVNDTGPGLQPEMFSLIFEKFASRNTSSLLGITHSTGLGLTFCKLAVEAHNGSIHVNSEPDKGATFSFSIPLSL